MTSATPSSTPNSRQLTPIDSCISQFDYLLKVFTGTMSHSERPSPADNQPGSEPLSTTEKRHVAGLMRINHTGEVCAQALYQGQALTCRNPTIKQTLQESAQEENDHLYWCQQRVKDVNSHVSYLNPLWYLGSFSLGVGAGLVGDQWNLGFLAETEHQVVQHLDEHLQQLPKHDEKSQAILRQMRVDEAHHAEVAEDNGAAKLPTVVKFAMQGMSTVMKKVTYYV